MVTQQQEEIFQEVVIKTNRVTKVTAGGKQLSFNALVVVGNSNGKVGCALGKARDLQFAIQKAFQLARKNLIEVPIVNDTIPHDVIGKNSAARVFLKPARKGTGIIASFPIRAIAECSGIKNLIAKVISASSNAINVVYATFDALKKLKTKSEIEKLKNYETA